MVTPKGKRIMSDHQLDAAEHPITQFASQPAEAQQSHADGPAATGHPWLRLQQTRGNRFVQRVMAMLQAAQGPTEAPEGIEEAIQQRRGRGQPLDHAVRKQMETSIGADFGDVGVHTDAEADGLNRSLHARAFTTGRNIFFRQGAYDPGTSGGRELLAHELTHVVQQSGSAIRRKLVVGQPGDAYEQEADAVARSVMQHEDHGKVQRQPEEEKEEEKEEETVHRRAEGAPLQREAEEEEETTAQAKPEPYAVQRQEGNEEKEEEPVQMQLESAAAQRQGEQEEQKDEAG